MIRIDGSYGEGGGQILRTSVALSVISGIPVEVYNIRAKRKNPGLRPQHLTGILALKEISNAGVEGAEVGSKRILFYPGKIKGGRYKFDIGTAGSITLLLQTILPVLLLSGKSFEIEIKGGTDVKWSPSIDYYRFVYKKILEEIGFRFEMEVIKRGYYPKGGGLVFLKIPEQDVKVRNIEFLENGRILKVFGVVHSSLDLKKRNVCERIVRGAKEIIDFEERIEYSRALSTGCGITLVSEFEKTVVGSDVLCEKRVPAEEIGRRCAENLIKEMKSPIDKHMADHLILWISLFGGKFRTSEITMHTRTNIWVCENILGVKFKIDEEKREIGIDKGFISNFK